MSEDGRQRTDVRGRKTENRCQRTEDRGWRSEVRYRNAASGLSEPEAVGAIGAYPPACKPPAYEPTGWKRPRRECGKKEKQGAESYEGGMIRIPL